MWVAFCHVAKVLQSDLQVTVARPTILSATPSSVAAPFEKPSDLAWRVIGLLSLYRLLAPLVLIAMQSFAGPAWGLSTARPALFLAACIAYFTAALDRKSVV